MEDLSALRRRIEALLAGGLATDATPRGFDDREIARRVARLDGLDRADLPARLVAAGFTPAPWGDGDSGGEIAQSCSTCMYYEGHRRFCALPTLELPVEPDWSCALWRI